ncbi:hypothetical protein BGZ46_000773, partial [Entomortierella lignicola]
IRDTTLSSNPIKRTFTFHQTPSANHEAKPWWDQHRPHISLHGGAATRNDKNNPTTPASTTFQTTSIPSYAFSDRSIDTDCYNTDDELPVTRDVGELYDDDLNNDPDIDRDQEGDIKIVAHDSYRHSTWTTSSSESNSARVSQSPTQRQPSPLIESSAEVDRNWKKKDKGKEKALDNDRHNVHQYDYQHDRQHDNNDNNEDEDPSPLKRWKSKEKKRTKSLRDEGENGRFKRFLRGHKNKRIASPTIFDDPDLGWESDRIVGVRQPTSGVMTVSRNQKLATYHPILVESPFSSHVDLGDTNLGGRHVFVSSPASSILDGNDNSHNELERPEPSPIQSPPNDDNTNDNTNDNTRNSNNDNGKNHIKSALKTGHLSPGAWRKTTPSPSNRSGTTSPTLSSSSPRRNFIQRVSSWTTARESTPSASSRSLQIQTIQEGDEEDEKEEEDGEYFTLAKVISQDTESSGVGVCRPIGTIIREHQEQDAEAEEGAETYTSGNAVVKTSSPDKALKDPAVLERKQTSVSKDSKDSKETRDSKDTDLTHRESLATTAPKANKLFGRALFNRAPTVLKRRNDIHIGPEEHHPTSTICSLDKDCQFSPPIDSIRRQKSNKKQVRFLTKVQFASSRYSTLVAPSPVMKQDRMLVRRQVTERPGPHVFNAETARKMEMQSLGWREWWCVLKGPFDDKDSVKKSKKVSLGDNCTEKGRLEFYYNHKKIKASLILTSKTTINVYSSLDYSIAVTQNYRDAIGLTNYILRPRTISLACAWYMEIYTLLHGSPPIPSFIELGVPDFDVKIRVPIPDDPETESDDYLTEDDEEAGNGTALSFTLPLRGPGFIKHDTATANNDDTTVATSTTSASATTRQPQRYKTAISDFPARMASKTFYLQTNDDNTKKPTLVAPDEVTPKMLRSHALSLLKQVPDWTEVVSLWQDPKQHGDVALCWKRYDRIEWIYWDDRIFAETDNLHLRKDHIGFADGSDWIGKMDETVVGPQVLDKTHKLELRPITHYPSKVPVPNEKGKIEMLPEPDPIEGYLIRVSTFSGNPVQRFRRLYLTSHDHLLMYTVPIYSHSPGMQNAGQIDPEALVFCVTPHHSADPDHKDMAQSRSVRRLKAQVRSAQGFIDMTKIGSVRVLKVREWNEARHLSFKKNKERRSEEYESRMKKLSNTVKRMEGDVKEAMAQRRNERSKGQDQLLEQGQDPNLQKQPTIVVGEADNYFFPTEQTKPVEEQGSSSSQENQDHQNLQQQSAIGTDLAPIEPLASRLGKSFSIGTLNLDSQKRTQHELNHQQNQQRQDHGQGSLTVDHGTELQSVEPLSNRLANSSSTGHLNHHNKDRKGTNIMKKTATFVVDALHAGRRDPYEDSSVIEIEMEDGKSCVRFRAFNAEAARLWRDQLEKLAHYWKLRKHQDVRDHMAVAKSNSLQLSSEDDDEHHVTVGGGGITIEDWDNDRASVSPEIWNWCVVNGCRSVTKSGFVYFKPSVLKTFRKMFLVLTEGFLMLFHPHRRSKTGRIKPSTACRLSGIYSLKDIYIYSGHFSDEDTVHGTNDESEHLPRFFPDGLIVDDPDEDCTFSIWRGKRRKMFSHRGSALMTMSSRPVVGSSRVFGKHGLLSSMIKDGVVYGAPPRHCSVFRARSRPDLEEWVHAINNEIERIVRAERKRIHNTGHM